MLSYKESLEILKETKALQQGHFILSSGLHSDEYVQCAKLLSFPEHSSKICSSLCEKIKEEFGKVDIVLSPAIGGIVVGYEVARQLGVQGIFSERENGNLILRRGFSIPKKSKVLIVEDVITTGKSAIECSKIIYENKSTLVGYACIIDRSNKDISIKEKVISQIKLKFKTFNENEVPEEIKKINPIKPGSRNSSIWIKKN